MADRMLVLEEGDRFITLDRTGLPHVFEIDGDAVPVRATTPRSVRCLRAVGVRCPRHDVDHWREPGDSR